MSIKRTKYCALKSCKKPTKGGEYCCYEHAVEGTMIKAKKKAEKTGGPVTMDISFDVKKIKRVYIKKPISFNLGMVPKQKKPIRKVSKKRAARLKEYTLKRAAFLQNKICPITGRPATEIHHIRGRDNKWLNDIRYWLAVTREGHIWIHANPVEAEAKGYIVKRSTK